MTQINPGTAATLAHNTLTAQISAIIAGASGATKSQAESLLALVDSNMQLIIDSSNHQVDELNELIDELEKRDSELAKSQAEAKQYGAELTKLRAGRIDDEKKIRAIMDTHEQIKNQRDNYKREADEVGKVKVEIKRLKAQAERHDAAQAKKDVELAEARQTIDRLRARLTPVTDAVRGCTDLMRFVRQTLIFEGLAPEQSIDCNGETYHIYRRPGDIAKAFQPLHTDRVLSRDHQFYFRVETNAGYHFDVVPLDGGDVAAAKPKAIPAGVKKHLLGLFTAETLFDYDKAAMRSDPLSERLDEIDKTLVPLDALLQGLEKQLITNQVVTNSTVNRNKKRKGK